MSTEEGNSVSVLIAGGGTGGHIMPALAVCNALVKKGIPETSIEFLGSKNGQEAKLLEGTKFKLNALDSRPLNRKLNLQLLYAVITMIKSIFVGIRLVKNINPKVVVSVGGFASVPGAIGAKVNSIPLVVINLDKGPGLAIKLASFFSTEILDGFEGTSLRDSKFVGIPIRSEIVDAVDKKARLTSTEVEQIKKPLKLPLEGYIVVLMGGSLGAKAINDLGKDLAIKFNEEYLKSIKHEVTNSIGIVNIVHLAGSRGINEVESSEEVVSNYILRGFESNMELLYLVSDLVVCRAGASTVAEILAMGVPSVLIPLPNAPRNHQYLNALTYSKVNACLLIEQKVLNLEFLYAKISELLTDQSRLKEISQKAKEMSKIKASEEIAECIIGYVNGN